MSQYLDELIKALEAEATEGRAELERSRAKDLREPKQAASQLKRTLQRLEILKNLQKAETGRSTESTLRKVVPKRPPRRERGKGGRPGGLSTDRRGVHA